MVEAAAGTGKTTELVKRILRVLATGRATMRQIVAVTFTEKAAGELKLRLREALEQERASAQDSLVRDRLEDALATLEDAHVNTIHGFCAELLRERPVEACVDPLFSVLTEPLADRLYSRAFRAWLQDALTEPPEGLRRALRRTSGPFGRDADGPIDRLRGAGRALAEWRDFPQPWKRPPFDRATEIDRHVGALHQLADLTASASSRRDNLYVDTDAVRRLSDQIRLEQSFGQTRSRRVGSAARRPDARPRFLADAQRQRVQVRQRGLAHRVLAARDGSLPTSSSFGRRRTPISPRVCSWSSPAQRLDTKRSKRPRARSISRTCSFEPRDLIRVERQRAPASPAKVHADIRRRVPGYRSGSGRDTPAARAPT